MNLKERISQDPVLEAQARSIIQKQPSAIIQYKLFGQLLSVINALFIKWNMYRKFHFWHRTNPDLSKYKFIDF